MFITDEDSSDESDDDMALAGLRDKIRCEEREKVRDMIVNAGPERQAEPTTQEPTMAALFQLVGELNKTVDSGFADANRRQF